MKVEPISQAHLQHLRKVSLRTQLVIVPHDNPDVDAIVSACMCHLALAHNGIPSSICLRTQPDEITRNIIKNNNLLFPDEYLEEIPPDASLILTDWFSVPDVDNHIAAIFDHHPTDIELEADIVIEASYSATAKLIYDLFCAADATMPEDLRRTFVHNALHCIYVDTQSMRSSRFNRDDLAWIDTMIAAYGYDAAYLYTMGLCLNDLSVPVEDLARNGEKRYVLPNGKNGYISYIQVLGYRGELDAELREEMLEMLAQDKQLSYAWHMIVDLGEDKTSVLKCSHDSDGVISWHWNEYAKLLSRANDIYPQMKKANRR